MKRIGITGGIGAGKTIITKIFAALGISIYYADARTRELQTIDPELVDSIKKLFGNKAYTTDGQLNREFVAAEVFNDKEKLEKLNALVHPKVFDDFEKWCLRHKEEPYIVKESALMFETGFYKKLDKIILVTAPVETRIQRVLLRDSFRKEADVSAIISKQMSDEEKTGKADFIIRNDESSLIVPVIAELDLLFRGKV